MLIEPQEVKGVLRGIVCNYLTQNPTMGVGNVVVLDEGFKKLAGQKARVVSIGVKLEAEGHTNPNIPGSCKTAISVKMELITPKALVMSKHAPVYLEETIIQDTSHE